MTEVIYPYEYHIVLDTTAFYRDFDTKSTAFKGLYHFLGVTNSILYIPEVVLEEIKKGFKEQLSKDYSKISQYISQYYEIAELKKSRDEIYADFVKRWDTRIRVNPKIELLKTPEIKIDILLKRSLEERAPFGQHSRGFRDAVIWHSVVELVNQNNKSFVFISNNSEDFGKDNLKPPLIQELDKNADKLQYFHDIGSFLGSIGERLDFLNDELVEKWVEESEQLLIATAHDLFKSELTDYFDLSNLEHYQEAENIDFGDVEYEGFEVDNYFIFKEDDEYYYIEVELWINMTVWVNYSRENIYANILENSDFHNAHMEDEVLSGYKPYSVQFRVNKKTKKHSFWNE